MEEREALIISARPTDRLSVDGFNEPGSGHFGYYIMTNTPLPKTIEMDVNRGYPESIDTPMDGAENEPLGGDGAKEDINRPRLTKADKKGKGKRKVIEKEQAKQTTRSHSPVSIRHLRFPHSNADLSTRMRIALLNYLQTQDLDAIYSDLAEKVAKRQPRIPEVHLRSREFNEVYRVGLATRLPPDFPIVQADPYLDARIRGDLPEYVYPSLT